MKNTFMEKFRSQFLILPKLIEVGHISRPSSLWPIEAQYFNRANYSQGIHKA
jgi:hypothetical protein